MWTYNHTNELYHYGIKGQKWGVRRFQNEDGSLTNAGEKRYYDADSNSTKTSSEKKKSKHRIRLEETYMKKGMSREEAEKAASKRIKTETILAVTAGVTVAAAAAYMINKEVKRRADQIIKSGDSMQRIIGDDGRATVLGIFFKKDHNASLHDSFYVTNNEYDNKNYRASFGWMKQRPGMFEDPNDLNNAWQMNIKATQDIKIASQKKGLEALKKSYSDDSGSYIPRNLQYDLRGKHKIPDKYMDKLKKGEKIPESIWRKMYDNFNSNLVGKPDNETEKNIRDKFYNTLKKQGYSGIQDINDLKWSNLRGKNPLIIFDKSKVNVESIDLIEENLRNAHREAYDRMQKLITKQKINDIIGKASAGVAVTTASNLMLKGINDITSYNKTVKNNTNNNGAKSFVNAYRQQHPKSTLSDKEILAMYNKGK